MSIGGFIRRNLFWAKDRLFNNSMVRKQYDDIKEILENYEIGRKRVEKYLLNLLNHAANTTEFYKEFKGKSLSQFPLVNKAIYKENYKLFMSDIFKNQDLHTMSTSGSTGTPFTVVQDKRKRSRVIAELKLFGELCGYKSHEKMAFLRVLSEKTRKKRYIELIENIYRLDTSSLNNESLERINNFIRSKRVQAILSYSSTLELLARFIQDNNYTSRDYNVRSVIAGGEALDIETRRRLKDVFGERCMVVSRYSNQEMGILAQDTGENSKFILNHGSYYFECLKIDSDEPAEMGEVGRLVITDLFNYAFPMIRYDTGDLGIIEKDDNHQWPVLKEIYGKQQDVIYSTKGEPVSPFSIAIYMWQVKGVSQWQFIQETESEYILKINGKQNRDLDKIVELMRNLLGNDANITINYVDEIPVLASNKQRRTVCKIQKS